MPSETFLLADEPPPKSTPKPVVTVTIALSSPGQWHHRAFQELTRKTMKPPNHTQKGWLTASVSAPISIPGILVAVVTGNFLTNPLKNKEGDSGDGSDGIFPNLCCHCRHR